MCVISVGILARYFFYFSWRHFLTSLIFIGFLVSPKLLNSNLKLVVSSIHCNLIIWHCSVLSSILCYNISYPIVIVSCQYMMNLASGRNKYDFPMEESIELISHAMISEFFDFHLGREGSVTPD